MGSTDSRNERAVYLVNYPYLATANERPGYVKPRYLLVTFLVSAVAIGMILALWYAGRMLNAVESTALQATMAADTSLSARPDVPSADAISGAFKAFYDWNQHDFSILSFGEVGFPLFAVVWSLIGGAACTLLYIFVAKKMELRIWRRVEARILEKNYDMKGDLQAVRNVAHSVYMSRHMFVDKVQVDKYTDAWSTWGQRHTVSRSHMNVSAGGHVTHASSHPLNEPMLA